MISAVSFLKPFMLPMNTVNQFVPMGNPYDNRGICHTVFLSKKMLSQVQKFTALPLTKINGFCSYAFIVCAAGIIYGFVAVTPTTETVVNHHSLIVGGEAESYKPIYYLQPQNVLIMESSSSNLVLLATKVESPLLVQVDL